MISVIMGVYNCKDKKALEKSIKSIINQTYKDWEFLICNDGSSDDTLQFLQKFEKLDNRIRILTYKNNRGLAHALNECIKQSKGNYIARQDDDDISHIDRLEKELFFLNNNKNFSFVGCIANVFDDNGVWGTYNLLEYPEKETFLWNSPFLHPSLLISKEAIKAVNGYREAKETRRCEDYDLFMRLYSVGYKGCNLQDKLYEYKIINNNRKYRPMKYRIDEAIVRYKGFKAMGILRKGIPYIIKPIIIGLIPQIIFKHIRQKQYDN